MSPRRFALVLSLFVAFAACTVFAVLRVIAPAPAPAAVQPREPLTPRLTRHLLLVIVDGLRYDVATDPLRMPHFSAAMARESSAEIWAGRISMTTAGILAMGTGQRGRLEQVVRNLSPGLATHNSWLQNARAAGLSLVAVGDAAWPRSFGPALSEHRDDPEGVAIDVDFNPQTFRNTRALLASSPDFLVAHFVTPDHQGHAYGILSERYAAHIRAFDAELAALLASLAADWTVVVTSDHGASNSGTHGADVALQRRSPIFAYGPGVRRGVKLERRLDQLELAATLPSLLGVPAPAHRTGHVISEWLDLPEEVRAELSCSNAEQVLSYAEHVAPAVALEEARSLARACRAPGSVAERSELAARSVSESDRAVDRSTGLLSPAALPWFGLVAALGVALGLALGSGLARRSIPAVLAMLALTLFMVVYVERLPGSWPNIVRVVCFVVGNLALLLLLLRPPSLLLWLERALPHAPAWLPGLLVLSYCANTRPEAYAALAVCALAYLPRLRFISAPVRAGDARRDLRDFAPVLLALLALLPMVLHENEGFSRLIASERLRPPLYAGLLFAWFAWQRMRAGDRRWAALAFAALAALCFASRIHVGAILGRLVWAASGLACLACCVRPEQGRASGANAVSAGVFSFAWLARDFELLPLLACVTLACVVGERFMTQPAVSTEARHPHAALLVHSLFAFAVAYALRFGIQDGIDFGGMDFHAGAFAAPDVSATLIGSALLYKYALGAFLVLFALCPRWPDAGSTALPIAFVACFVARGLSLALMFFVGGNSYWTALRVLGDLPTALAMGFGAVFALGVLSLRSLEWKGAASEAARVHKVL